MNRLFLLLSLTLVGSGCTSFELTRVRNDIARQAPEAKIGDGYSFSFGRISLGLARLFVGLGGEDAEMAGAILQDVRRVQFAKYDVDGAFDGRTLSMPGRLQNYLDDKDWEHLASVRMEGEAVWVLYKEEDETVQELFAVIAHPDELVLAKIAGNLNNVVLTALAEQEIDIPFFGEPSEDALPLVATETAVEVASEMLP